MSNWDIEEAVKTIENSSTELYTALEDLNYMLPGLVKLTRNCDQQIFTISKLRVVAKKEGNLGNISTLEREEVEKYMKALETVTEEDVERVENHTPYDPSFRVELEAENAARIEAALKDEDPEEYVERWMENFSYENNLEKASEALDQLE